MDLDLWRPVLSVEGVTFVNLQYGDDRGAMDAIAARAGTPLVTDDDVDLDGNLDDAASQISALDLVITVSSTPAHLVGALGKGAWVIVPPVGPAGMWYWFTDRRDSPWYPHVELFRRQYGQSNDAKVLAEIAARLEQWVKRP